MFVTCITGAIRVCDRHGCRGPGDLVRSVMDFLINENRACMFHTLFDYLWKRLLIMCVFNNSILSLKSYTACRVYVPPCIVAPVVYYEQTHQIYIPPGTFGIHLCKGTHLYSQLLSDTLWSGHRCHISDKPHVAAAPVGVG